ncbi:MAG: hypothetical protein ACLGXA_03340 [Acidobacteriota bacterium]
MKRTLLRLLQVRELVEELARVDLEGRSAEMRDLKTAAEQHRQTVRSMHAEALDDLTGNPAAAEENRWLHTADGAIAARKEARLEAMAAARKPALEQAREVLFARRLERRQVEVLHAAQMEAEEAHRIRQDQNRTDDWFQSRRTQRKPRGK